MLLHKDNLLGETHRDILVLKSLLLQFDFLAFNLGFKVGYELWLRSCTRYAYTLFQLHPGRASVSRVETRT